MPQGSQFSSTFGCVTVVKSYSAMKMDRTNSAPGHITSSFPPGLRSWTELSSRPAAPHGLVDLQAWHVVCGDDGGGESWRLVGLRR